MRRISLLYGVGGGAGWGFRNSYSYATTTTAGALLYVVRGPTWFCGTYLATTDNYSSGTTPPCARLPRSYTNLYLVPVVRNDGGLPWPSLLRLALRGRCTS